MAEDEPKSTTPEEEMKNEAQDSPQQENNGEDAATNNSISGHGDSDGGKIFVGGISSDTTNEDLKSYFSKFGEVSKVEVKIDRVTGRSRGFAFVEFATAEGCKKSLKDRKQQVKGKGVEIKPAKSRENKKVFIGGLPGDFPEDQLKEHFEVFGPVEDIEWPYDKQRAVRRNFAFVVFEDEESANKASAENKQKFGDRECDVKKAVPQSRRMPMGAMGMQMGGMRGGGGYNRGGRGGGQGYGAYGGYNMYGGAGSNYGGTWGANQYGGGGWGDWYGQNAAAAYGANYYGAGNVYSGTDGGYGYGDGQAATYDYNQQSMGAAGQHQQVGMNSTTGQSGRGSHQRGGGYHHGY